ncbi:MAG: glycerate kinase [Betaproteobacteria bacterium]|nr:glycerate kinase [Betaproteobacteria bacterium]
MRDARILLMALYDAAVRRAMPAAVMARYLPEPPAGRTVAVGAGKAAGAMVHALEDHWPAGAALSGLVVTRYGHIPPRDAALAPRVRVVEAGHPVPDANGERAAREILGLVGVLTERDLVLCLISGGGSALLTLPAQGVTLSQKQEINRALLLSGANIAEMNCVRKHLSAIKGGRLGAACAPARVVTLMISDVPGDDPSVIASGPTVPDAGTCADALEILDRYRIAHAASLRQMLRDGGSETPKPGDARFLNHKLSMIATPRQSLQAAAEAAHAMGVTAHILSDDMEGESREVGRAHAAIARSIRRRGEPFARPCVLLSGGETTVTIGQNTGGRGGRAGEFALGAALALKGEPGITVLAADTDGIDGSEDNAGAIVTPDSLARAAHKGLKARAYLLRNDSYGFFSALGDLVVTGPTYTNVNDFRAILIED